MPYVSKEGIPHLQRNKKCKSIHPSLTTAKSSKLVLEMNDCHVFCINRKVSAALAFITHFIVRRERRRYPW